jgi:hypothetical protein
LVNLGFGHAGLDLGVEASREDSPWRLWPDETTSREARFDRRMHSPDCARHSSSSPLILRRLSLRLQGFRQFGPGAGYNSRDVAVEFDGQTGTLASLGLGERHCIAAKRLPVAIHLHHSFSTDVACFRAELWPRVTQEFRIVLRL